MCGERGGYLLPFDLLWSDPECVLGCRADLQSRDSHRPRYGISFLGISLSLSLALCEV